MSNKGFKQAAQNLKGLGFESGGWKKRQRTDCGPPALRDLLLYMLDLDDDAPDHEIIRVLRIEADAKAFLKEKTEGNG